MDVFLVGLLKIVIFLFSGNGCFFGWFIKDCCFSFQWKLMFVVYFLVGLLKIVIFLFSGNGCPS